MPDLRSAIRSSGKASIWQMLLVKRLSDSEDRIPVMVSERLVDVTQDYDRRVCR